jgi:hypothetical protein
MIEPAGFFDSGERSAASALKIVTGRIFLLDQPRYVQQVPPFLSAEHSGLVLCGKGSNAKVEAIWRQSTGPLLIDPAEYLDRVATPAAPFALPEGDNALFGLDLNVVLDSQRHNHAAAAITPSRYVRSGDSGALEALVLEAQAIRRDDVIVAVPVALPWLTLPEHLPELIAGLQQIPHPKAIMFGAQKNPFDVAAATANFRRLLAETTSVGLWRADVPAAFDCLAHGGIFAGIGAGGSLRHLIPADEKPKATNPMAHTPAVLMPSMLRYVRGGVIANKYADIPAPRCDCSVCAGASLDRFDSLDGETRAIAHAHNAAVWTEWLSGLLDHATDAERRHWWRAFCRSAADAHAQENARVRQLGAFKPSPSLRKLATLPLSGDADDDS